MTKKGNASALNLMDNVVRSVTKPCTVLLSAIDAKLSGESSKGRPRPLEAECFTTVYVWGTCLYIVLNPAAQDHEAQ